MVARKKELGLLDVFAVASGAMISSGLFVLPAIAYVKAGSAVVLSYFFTSLLVIPSVLSKAELATAMPRAGGTYFFVERSLGSIWGLFGGLANWFSVALKSVFAVVGMAVFIEVVLQVVFHVGASQGNSRPLLFRIYSTEYHKCQTHKQISGSACRDTVGHTCTVYVFRIRNH